MNFYRCSICGNVIEIIDGDINRIKCCGKTMELLEANTVDASFEKHVPHCVVKGDKVEVQIGEAVHPMIEEHYIMWIAIIKDNKITRVDLKPDEQPNVTFDYEKGSTVYAYCNLHGLWKKEI